MINLNLAAQVGQKLTCKYPVHGKMNILKTRKGEIQRIGVTMKGENKGCQYVTIIHEPDEDGREYTTLIVNKMLPQSVQVTGEPKLFA